MQKSRCGLPATVARREFRKFLIVCGFLICTCVSACLPNRHYTRSMGRFAKLDLSEGLLLMGSRNAESLGGHHRLDHRFRSVLERHWPDVRYYDESVSTESVTYAALLEAGAPRLSRRLESSESYEGDYVRHECTCVVERTVPLRLKIFEVQSGELVWQNQTLLRQRTSNLYDIRYVDQSDCPTTGISGLLAFLGSLAEECEAPTAADCPEEPPLSLPSVWSLKRLTQPLFEPVPRLP